MFSYAIEEWLLFFYIYCVFGWCFESTYVSIRTGHPVNRGFMQAPFLPLYGSGAILLLVLALPEQVKVFLAVFITAVLAGDFALSFRDALDLREILIDMEKMEVILKDVEAQLSARYEVKISRKV